VIQGDPGAQHRAGDLGLEVLAGYDDEDPGGDAVPQERVGDAGREARLPRPRGRDDEGVFRTVGIPLRERRPLPSAERKPPSVEWTRHKGPDDSPRPKTPL
jgi:hypothetical protein